MDTKSDNHITNRIKSCPNCQCNLSFVIDKDYIHTSTRMMKYHIFKNNSTKILNCICDTFLMFDQSFIFWNRYETYVSQYLKPSLTQINTWIVNNNTKMSMLYCELILYYIDALYKTIYDMIYNDGYESIVDRDMEENIDIDAYQNIFPILNGYKIYFNNYRQKRVNLCEFAMDKIDKIN